MKKMLALLLGLVMLMSTFACAEELGISVDSSVDVEAAVNENGAPTYGRLKSLWAEAEAAYAEGAWETAVLKYLECASVSNLMETALSAPLVSMANAGDSVKDYVWGGAKFEKNKEFWKNLTYMSTTSRNEWSYINLVNVCDELTALCELKAGVCYFNLGRSNEALVCFTAGFAGLELRAIIQDFTAEDIVVEELYVNEFMPTYNKLLGLDEVFVFE